MSYNVPFNIFGYQQPKTGSAYTGIYVWAKVINEVRQNIQCKLNTTLIAGKKYRMGFYASLADTMNAKCSSIDIHLSTDSFFVSQLGLISLNPTFSNDTANYLGSKTDWMLVADTFVAQGNERFMTIANFKPDSLTHYQYIGPQCTNATPSQCGCYYYIDDVFLEPLDGVGLTPSPLGRDGVGLFPNPNNGSFTIETDAFDKQVQFVVTDAIGQVVDNIPLKSSSTIYKNSNLKNGIYFYTTISNGTVTSRGKFLVQR